MLCRHILPPSAKFSFVTYFLHSLLSSILFLLITLNTCTPFVYKESRGRSGQRNALSKQPRGQNCRDGKVFTRDLPQPSLLRLFLLLFYLRLQPPILKIDLTDWVLAGLWQQCVAGLIQTIEARTNPIGDPRRGRFPWRQRFCSFSFQLFSSFSSAPSSLAACRRARAVLRPDLFRMYFVAWHSCDCYNYWEREKEERAAENELPFRNWAHRLSHSCVNYMLSNVSIPLLVRPWELFFPRQIQYLRLQHMGILTRLSVPLQRWELHESPFLTKSLVFCYGY